MSDVTLLALGASVTFIALAGAYVFLRERYERAMHSENEKTRSLRKA